MSPVPSPECSKVAVSVRARRVSGSLTTTGFVTLKTAKMAFFNAKQHHRSVCFQKMPCLLGCDLFSKNLGHNPLIVKLAELN